MNKSRLHQPVLLTPVLELLKVKKDQWYVDATFGRGGHTKALLDQKAKVVAFDFDQQAIEYGQEHFAQDIEAERLYLVRENFAKLKEKLDELGDQVGPIAGIIFDFGTTVDQLKSTRRGFSFEHQESELDMRMDQRLGVQAKDLLKVLPVKQLTKIFHKYGGESQAKKIAKAIVEARNHQDQIQLNTVGGLVEIIMKTKSKKRGHLHPSTKVFQALRIAVNDELNNIERALPQALELLKPGGRLVTIAFHEGEDRIVKHQVRKWQKQQRVKILTKKPITPSDKELEQNPSSRSAKLRAIEKC